MPYIESETKAKLREVRNAAEPVLDGITDKLVYYEVTKEHFQWLLGQAEKVEKLQVQLDAKLTFINNGKEEELYALQEELIAWETGVRQTSKHYNSYRERGVQLYEKDGQIKDLSESIEFAIKYLSASDIGQVQMVVKALKQVLGEG